MSYCRWTEGDVYAIKTDKEYVCYLCKLQERAWVVVPITLDRVKLHANFETKTAKEMLEHLKEHRNAGHKMPRSAFTKLRKEMKR